MSVEFDRGSPGRFDSRTLKSHFLIGGLGVKKPTFLVTGRIQNLPNQTETFLVPNPEELATGRILGGA